MEIDGLLLCSECENLLKVEVYDGGYGFYKVYPCKHCVSVHWVVKVWRKLLSCMHIPQDRIIGNPISTQDTVPKAYIDSVGAAIKESK